MRDEEDEGEKLLIVNILSSLSKKISLPKRGFRKTFKKR